MATLPTLNESLTAIKNGEAFNKSSSGLESIGTRAAALPPAIASSITSAQSAALTTVQKAQSTVGRDMSVTMAHMDLKQKLAVENNGNLLPNICEVGLGPLSIMKDATALIDNITSGVDSLIDGVGDALGAVAGGAEAAITAFYNSIPTVGTPAYTAFMADANNAFKKLKIDELTSGLSTFATSLSTGIGDIAAAGEQALSDAMGDLKAYALAVKFSSPMPDCVKSAVDNGMDANVASKKSIEQAESLTGEAKDAVETKRAEDAGDKVAPVDKPDLTPINASDIISPEDDDKYGLFRKNMAKINNTMVELWISSDAGKRLKAVEDSYYALQLSKPDRNTWSTTEFALETTYNSNREKMDLIPQRKAILDFSNMMQQIVYNSDVVHSAWAFKHSRIKRFGPELNAMITDHLVNGDAIVAKWTSYLNNEFPKLSTAIPA